MPQSEPQASRDAKDNKFLAAAEAAKADYLVSEDRDLLDLTEHQGTRIIPAHEFLQVRTIDFLLTHRRNSFPGCRNSANMAFTRAGGNRRRGWLRTDSSLNYSENSHFTGVYSHAVK
jgi:hypothetical protein